jgi:hypothetical protein
MNLAGMLLTSGFFLRAAQRLDLESNLLFRIFATEKQAGSSRTTLYAPATAHVKNGNNYGYIHAFLRT